MENNQELNYSINNSGEFNNFIEIYRLIVKQCSIKGNHYTTNVYYLNNELYLTIKDDINNKLIYNNTISCNKIVAETIALTISKDFVINHHITISSFKNLEERDILEYRHYNKKSIKYTYNSCYSENNLPMLIHELDNNKFTLRIHYYDGICSETEKIHHMALDKMNKDNQLIKK